MGALEALLAGQNGAPAKPAGQGGALEKLLAGGQPAEAEEPVAAAPVTKPGFSASRAAKEFGQGVLGSTADAIDLVYDLVSGIASSGAEVGTRAYHGIRNLAGASNLSRREISVDAQKKAEEVSAAIGGPARKALQGLGLIPEGEMLVGKAMGRAWQVAEQAAANFEANTNGRVLKEDVLMGIRGLFAAAGVKGAKYTAEAAADRGKAKAALKDFAAWKEAADAQKAKAAADKLTAEANAAAAVEAVQGQTSEGLSKGLKKSAEEFSTRASAERDAYDLMQSGAPTKKVEAAIKKNPAVGVALEEMRKRREQAATFLQEEPAVFSRADDSTAPDAAIAMKLLRRPSEIGPAEFAARDAAAGITRGPLGEPIFSASPADLATGRGGRSVPDPRRRPVTGSGLMGVEAPPASDPFGAAASGGVARPDPRRPAGPSGLMGLPPREQFDPFGAAVTGGRSSPDPKRTPATGSGLEGRPVKRDSLGTPLSPNQTLAVVGATGLGLAALYADERDTGDLAAAAAGGALLLGKGRGISLEAIRALPDTATLREIRDASAYTLNTLENLPGNRAVHSKQAVGELLRRQEVTKAERDIIQGVLDSVPGETITAKQLMAGVKERTGDFELTSVESGQFADYGLAGIGRTERSVQDGHAWIPDDATPEEAARLEAEAQAAFAAAPEATTTIYQLRGGLGGGTDNHFGDPRYFAHTRSFYENGVKHVVELQSDLAQKAGKVLGAEERAKLQATLDEDVAHFTGMRALGAAAKKADVLAWLDSLTPEQFDAFNRKHGVALGDRVIEARQYTREELGALNQRDLQQMLHNYKNDRINPIALRVAENKAKLAQTGALEPISPMLKRWDKRLVREELAESARGRVNPEYKAAREKLKEDIRRLKMFEEIDRSDSLGANYLKQEIERKGAALLEIPERLPPEPVVRFATADTVAKVEGWPRENPAERLRADIKRTNRNLVDERGRLTHYKEQAELALQSAPRDAKAGMLEAQQKQIADRQAQIELLEEQLARQEERLKAAKDVDSFRPEHQGIYDRYAKETTAFLKSLGGKEVTDSAGHTWIEVPTEGTRKTPAGKRVQQFGAADPELLAIIAAVGGGAYVASLFFGDNEEKPDLSKAGILASLATFGRSRSRGLSEMARTTVGGAERYLGIVSTRVGNMSPVLLRRMREHERGVLTRTNDYLKAISPFVEGLRKVPEALRTQLDAAILTGDPAKINAILGKSGNPELVAQFRQARALLNKVGAELMQAGKLKGLLSDYYPRIVVDVPGLLKAIGAEERTFIEKQIAEATRKTQREALRDLTPFEVSQIINKALKSPRTGNGKPGFLKRRAVEEVTPDLAKFYAPASESLPLYLRAVSKELERAKFFGENLLRDPVTGAVNLDESIGNLVHEERLAGRVTAEQAVELGDILRSRFGPGERATSRPLQAAKNLAYAGLLGHVTSAITQLGDVAISAAAHGILPTIKAIQQNVTRQPARATVRDLGMIDHMAEEIVSASRAPVTVFGRQVSSAKFLDKAFRYSGFSWVDKIGKNVSIQAARNKLEGWAKSPAGIKRIEAKYGEAYGKADTQQLIADLRSGELTDLVKATLFSELSDVQPISKLEVPQGYLDNPNGRVLYMLKTFMLKQADIVRREVVQEFRKGNRAKAAEKALRFGLALGIGGATTQWINNWLLGRDKEAELGDIPLNMLKTFGWSQYVLDKDRSGSWPAIAIEMGAEVATPPWEMFKEIAKADPKAIQFLPVVGRIYYARDWFDLMDESGSEKFNRKLEADERRKEREE